MTFFSVVSLMAMVLEEAGDRRLEAELGAATGEYLVGVGLMADVPDQPVARGIKNIVKRDREVHHAEPWAK